MKIAFVSKNKYKVEEVEILLKDSIIEVVCVPRTIDELQTQDHQQLVQDKLLKAFKVCGRPVFVEHTSLHINYLNGFPGGLTETFWETLKHDRFAALVGSFSDPSIIAKTTIGYCDGKSVHFFSGEITGKASKIPKGPREFQWDSVFIPDGFSQTFAEMGVDEKNKISMRKIAYEKFMTFIDNDERFS